MAVYDAAARRDVAAYARRYFARTITLEQLLAKLDKGAVGQVPAERVYPWTTLWGLVFGAAFFLWAGLFAARNLDRLLTGLYRGLSLPFWDAPWRIVVVSTLAMVTVWGTEGWIHRLYLYRTRKLSSDDTR